MKKLLLILIIAIIGCAAPKQDNVCKPYYYHVTLDEDSLVINDCMGGRHVASVPYDKIGILDSIFVADNE